MSIPKRSAEPALPRGAEQSSTAYSTPLAFGSRTLAPEGGSVEVEAEWLANNAMAAAGRPPPPLRAPQNSGRLAAVNRGGDALPSAVRQEFEARFTHDFSQVRVHSSPEAAASARALDAQAFTVGRHIGFARGAYQPDTAAGKRLLAHELAHTVQNARGAVPDQIQCRRVPDAAGLNAAVPPAADVAGVVNARTGLARIFARAWAELTAPNKAAVITAAKAFGIVFTNQATLITAINAASRDQLLKFEAALRTADPTVTLGDPALIDTGPRPATSDAANITTLVTGANAVFDQIAAGTNDADLTQVFGAANIATAKTRYAAAKSRMNTLKSLDKIVTDRSGYNAEAELGGLSNSDQIAVAPSVIDTPADKESVLTLIHESLHAGGTGVSDDAGYIGFIADAIFLSMTEADKLATAAHYEVVPRRILVAANSFPGKTFVPAGTTSGGVTAPPRTAREEAVAASVDEFREAWTCALNLHTLFVRVFRTPGEWQTLDLGANYSGAVAGTHFEDALPFWSNVEQLTIHKRLGAINPAGPPAVRPVTLIDVALSEGLVRMLAAGMNKAPQTEADALAFETSEASAAERSAAAASIAAEKALLIRLVLLKRVGSITGNVTRDIKVVSRLATANAAPNFTDMLQKRPASFP